LFDLVGRSEDGPDPPKKWIPAATVAGHQSELSKISGRVTSLRVSGGLGGHAALPVWLAIKDTAKIPRNMWTPKVIEDSDF